MAVLNFSRWLAPVVLAAGLCIAALTPAPARADDDLVRVLVNVADIVYHGGQPYYRHGDYGYNDRVVVVRDRYRRPTYYRYVPRDYYRVAYRAGPPYGRAHGYYRNAPRYDYRDRYSRHDRRDRWNDDDDWDDDRRDRRHRGRDRDDD